jgi:hypothetical protein
MKTIVTTLDLISQCRTALLRFWNDSFSVEATGDGVAIALPLLYPSGLQVAVSLKPIAETIAILSDRGETLGNLFNSGVSLEGATAEQFISDRLRVFDLKRDGLILQKQVSLPPDGLDIHLFGEALVSLAHLIYRYEPEAVEEDVAGRTVHKLFSERALKPRRNFVFEGLVEKRIQIDYYLEGQRGLALEVIKRKGDLLPYMERWGWRWTDLRKNHPQLLRAMVYDPDNQKWESTSLAIGQSVCEVFCPYFDQPTLQNVIEDAL